MDQEIKYEAKIIDGIKTVRYKERIYISASQLSRKFNVTLRTLRIREETFQSYQSIIKELNLTEKHILHLSYSDVPELKIRGDKGEYYVSYLYISRTLRHRVQKIEIFSKDIKNFFNKVKKEYLEKTERVEMDFEKEPTEIINAAMQSSNKELIKKKPKPVKRKPLDRALRILYGMFF